MHLKQEESAAALFESLFTVTRLHAHAPAVHLVSNPSHIWACPYCTGPQQCSTCNELAQQLLDHQQRRGSTSGFGIKMHQLPVCNLSLTLPFRHLGLRRKPEAGTHGHCFDAQLQLSGENACLCLFCLILWSRHAAVELDDGTV